MQQFRNQPLLGVAVDHAPVGMAILDSDLRYVHINSALAELNGHAVEDHIGRRLEEMVPPEIVERIAPEIQRVLETGEARHGIEFRRGTPGDPRALEATYFPVNGNAVGALVLDMTERDRALARARYLARASAALGSSLELGDTLEHIVSLAVPEVADWAFVELVQPDGSIARVAWDHADPEKDEIARAYDQRYPLDPEAPAGSPAVIRTGEPELVQEVPERFYEQVTADEEQLRILQGMGFRSYVIVPLIARGRVIGDLALAYSVVRAALGDRGPRDAARAGRLAARGVDNARIYEERRRRPRRCSRACCRRDLPADRRRRARRALRPRRGRGRRRLLRRLPGAGRLDVAIGDVAARDGRRRDDRAARHTLRIAAPSSTRRSPRCPPRRGDAARTTSAPASAVAACCRSCPTAPSRHAGRRGPPSPLVRRLDGRVEDTVRPGALLGALAGPDASEDEVTLEPGDVLVLYTDGVTEARRPRRRAARRGGPGDRPGAAEPATAASPRRSSAARWSSRTAARATTSPSWPSAFLESLTSTVTPLVSSPRATAWPVRSSPRMRTVTGAPSPRRLRHQCLRPGQPTPIFTTSPSRR